MLPELHLSMNVSYRHESLKTHLGVLIRPTTALQPHCDANVEL